MPHEQRQDAVFRLDLPGQQSPIIGEAHKPFNSSTSRVRCLTRSGQRRHTVVGERAG
jgi:hypothetical protein